MTRPIPSRVLILGNPRADTVGDSYRRALANAYRVEVVNPFELVTVTLPRWTGMSSIAVQNLFHAASRAALSDPLAIVYPKLVRAAAELSPDVILITAIESISPKAIRDLRRASPHAKVIGVFSDAISNFGRGYFFDADYDALFFKDRYIVDKLRTKLGWKHAYYLPQACDPTLHRDVKLTEADLENFGCDLAIAGNLHYFRAVQMAALSRHSIKIYGARPPRWLEHAIAERHAGLEVAGETKCRAMRAARIVLNNNHYAEIAGTNKRTFEVSAMNAFQLTDTPALSDVFIPDVEVATFNSLADMVEKVEYYLPRPELRQAMAQRAFARAHREHTYAHRWVAHLEVLGLAVGPEFPVQADDTLLRAE